MIKILLPVLILACLFPVSCASIPQEKTSQFPPPDEAKESTYFIINSVSTFIGTALGATIGFLAVSGDDDGGKAAITSIAAAVAGGVIGWYFGGKITEYMRANEKPDDSKIREFYEEYQLIR